MIVATLIGFATLVGPSTQALADPPPPPSESTARTELAALTVGTPHSMDGYSRDAFDIWAGQLDGCTTRQDVLARDGDNVVEGGDGCQPLRLLVQRVRRHDRDRGRPGDDRPRRAARGRLAYGRGHLDR